MLLVASGIRGLAPVRALLNWTPVQVRGRHAQVPPAGNCLSNACCMPFSPTQAHATKHNIACLYVAR